MYNHEIDTFLEVVKTGSFSQAAKNLYISKVAVAQQIENLEKKLNTLLFNRTTHGVELTEVGDLFFKRARELVTLSKNIEYELSTYKPHLVIGAGYLNQQLLIPKLVKSKELADSDVLFQEISDYNHIPSNVELIEMIRSREPISKQGFTFIAIKKIQYVLAIPHSSDLVSKNSVSLQDLIGKTVALPAENITGDSKLNNKFNDNQYAINVKNYLILNRAQINQCQYAGDYLLIPEPLSNLCSPYIIKKLNFSLTADYGFYIKSENISLIDMVKKIFSFN